MSQVKIETSPMMIGKLKAQNGEDAKLKKACQDFEAVFTTYMLKTMRSTIPTDNSGAFGNQREIFESMFDQTLSTEISRSRKPLGIGDALYRELSKKLK
jgi:flagellar protein FlgJ